MDTERRQRIQQAVAGGWLKLARTRSGRKANLVLLHLSLNGLGYNHYLDPVHSGEEWFVRVVLPALGVETAADVGANVGSFTVLLLESLPGGVAAFEPGADALNVLERLKLTYGDRLTVHPVAVGESDGRLPFFVSRESNTWSSLHGEVDDGHLGLEDSGFVQVRALDSLISEGAMDPPDFLKIDVEGSEGEVLIGARQLLRSGHVRAVQLEFNAHQLAVGRTLRDFAKELSGYEFFRITPGRLEPIQPNHWTSNIFQYCNLAAVRSDLVSSLPEPRRQ